MYTVTSRETSASPHLATPGEHYTLEDPAQGVRWYRRIEFFRTRKGREIATDDLGAQILPDGDLYRQIRAAVELYDQEHPK